MGTSNHLHSTSVKAKNTNTVKTPTDASRASQQERSVPLVDQIKPVVIQGLQHKMEKVNQMSKTNLQVPSYVTKLEPNVQKIIDVPIHYHNQLPNQLANQLPNQRQRNQIHNVPQVHLSHATMHGMKPANQHYNILDVPKVHLTHAAMHGINPANQGYKISDIPQVHVARGSIHGMKPANQGYKISDIPLFKMEAAIPSYNMQVGRSQIDYQRLKPLMVNSISELHPLVITPHQYSIPKFSQKSKNSPYFSLPTGDPVCELYPWVCGYEAFDVCQMYPIFCEAAQIENLSLLYPHICQPSPSPSTTPDQLPFWQGWWFGSAM